MIFVTVGSREYPFDRLLIALDALAGANRLPEPLLEVLQKFDSYLTRFS